MNKLLLSVVLGGLLVVSVPVSAETTNTQTQTTQTTNTTTNTNNTTTKTEVELEKSEAAKNPEELKARLQQAKNRLKTKLTNADIQRIVSKCGGSQTKINTFLQGRYKNDGAYQARYEAFIARLEKLSAVLKQNNIDSTQLDQQIVILKQKYDAYKTSVTAFRSSVADAKAVDCKVDPTGFKSALEDARTKALAVKQAHVDLDTYAKTTIKTTLQNIKAVRS